MQGDKRWRSLYSFTGQESKSLAFTSGFVLHPDALADLKQIWEFIATDSPDAANRLLDEIHDAIGFVSGNRSRGVDLTSRPLRFHAVRNFLIVYAPDEKPL